jgi:hypothetical protein
LRVSDDLLSLLAGTGDNLRRFIRYVGDCLVGRLLCQGQDLSRPIHSVFAGWRVA